MTFLENLSPRQVLYRVIGFMAATWTGGLLTGRQTTDGELIGIAAIIVSYAALDHLHGIRRAVERPGRDPRATDPSLASQI